MKNIFNNRGQTLVELVLVVGLSAIMLPGLLTGLIASRNGKAEQAQRMQAVALLKETEQAVRSVRNYDWTAFAVNGTFHPVVASGKWSLVSGAQSANSLTQQITIGDVQRNATSGAIVTSGGVVDPSTKKVDIAISWTQPYASAVTTTMYLSRTANLTHTDSTVAEFNAGILSDTQVVNATGGAVQLANNNRAKWCTPAFSSATIDLPDGPPVAVAATSSATSITVPNDVFVATAPSSSSAIKLAYVNVVANVATPTATLKGTFTLDSSKYSVGTFPVGINLGTNNFKTNDIKYYKSSGGKTYALMATDLTDKEVIAVQINNGSGDAYQDSTNKIYKYWTYFNTIRYNGISSSNDQAPFDYGATSLAILGNRGYVSSGGYLYVFDLSNIDSKSPTGSTGLDIIGCRIQLDGYDCKPGSPGSDKKYDPGQSGTSWGDTAAPAHNDCSDGGNIELYATNDIFPVQVGSNTYVYVAVGAGTNPEFEIVNVSTVPTSSTNPRINNSSCGTIDDGSSSWKRISSLDFNSQSNTEEAANSVFAKADGSRAYISSNGGIDGNGNGNADSYQLYVLNTSNKSSPAFLSGSSGTGAQSGYYYASGANGQLYPRRSLTVLNGERAVLVGKDGVTDGNNANEYQVADITTEASPSYCGGLDFDQGFNDLTSVTELDGDNFVYMVANTTLNELKIIEGGPDSAIYTPTGTYTSSIFDFSYLAAANRFTATVNQPATTDLKLQIGVGPQQNGSCTNAPLTYVGPAGDASAFFTPVGASISGTIPFGNYNPNYQNPGRCVGYKAWFSNTDQTKTPVLYDMTTNYSP